MSANHPVISVKVYPGTAWQGLYVDGVLVANAWGQVLEISPCAKNHGTNTMLVTIGEPNNIGAFYHVTALAAATRQEVQAMPTSAQEKEVKPPCQS